MSKEMGAGGRFDIFLDSVFIPNWNHLDPLPCARRKNSGSDP